MIVNEKSRAYAFEIDSLIAVNIMEWERKPTIHGYDAWWDDTNHWQHAVTKELWPANQALTAVNSWKPTTDMNQAMECVEKIEKELDAYFWLERVLAHEGWECKIELGDVNGILPPTAIATGESAPLAICKAILKAKGIEYE